MKCLSNKPKNTHEKDCAVCERDVLGWKGSTSGVRTLLILHGLIFCGRRIGWPNFSYSLKVYQLWWPNNLDWWPNNFHWWPNNSTKSHLSLT